MSHKRGERKRLPRLQKQGKQRPECQSQCGVCRDRKWVGVARGHREAAVLEPELSLSAAAWPQREAGGPRLAMRGLRLTL